MKRNQGLGKTVWNSMLLGLILPGFMGWLFLLVIQPGLEWFVWVSILITGLIIGEVLYFFVVSKKEIQKEGFFFMKFASLITGFLATLPLTLLGWSIVLNSSGIANGLRVHVWDLLFLVLIILGIIGYFSVNIWLKKRQLRIR